VEPHTGEVYIVHFPIIQTVAALGVFAASAAMGLAVSAAAALIAAMALWWLVERPALRPDSAYRARA
jgi:peptidoglycan/LPS O-acetylase OafA/YrhL